MAKIKIWGFRCERCNHEWAPRGPEAAPTVCPKCKSPYWDTPRRDSVNPKQRVKCVQTLGELNGKTVEYEILRGKEKFKGEGSFSVCALGEGFLQITIMPPFDGQREVVLTQAEADGIKTHPGRKYRFSLLSRS